MALVKWKPFRSLDPNRELSLIEREFDRLFDDDLSVLYRDLPRESPGWSPSVDISEDADNLYIYAELPGLGKDDFKVTIEDDHLILEGEKKFRSREGETSYHCETCWGKFSRTFHLTANVDTEQISASYSQGVLNVRLPKKPEAKSKNLEIKIH